MMITPTYNVYRKISLDELLWKLEAFADPEYELPVTPVVNPHLGVFYKGDTEIKVTKLEWTIFEKLAVHGGQPVSKSALYRWLYPDDRESDPDFKIVDVVLCRLRKKCPYPIETVWGDGLLLRGYSAIRHQRHSLLRVA